MTGARKATARRSHDDMARSRFNVLAKGLRRTRGEMTKAESAWSELLEVDRIEGKVFRWRHESMRLRLTSPNTGTVAAWYTPDFEVILPDGTVVFDEVKGSRFTDQASILRLKLAADTYTEFRFRLVTQRTKKQGGGFAVKEM